MTSKDEFIRVGTSGFRNPHWRMTFFPRELAAEEMLAYYGRSFETVEVNGSFYAYLKPSTFKEWISRVPEGFRFSIKAPRHLIESSAGEALAAAWDRVRAMIEPLRSAGALGAILFQFPGQAACDPEWVDALLALPEFDLLDTSFEARAPEGFPAVVRERLAAAKVDTASVSRPDLPLEVEVTGPCKYFRFNGLKREGTYNYTFTELKELGERVRQAAQQAQRVYAYFNNPGKGCAPANATAFLHRILNDPPETVEE